MRLKKVLGFIFALTGFSLIAWSGLSVWQERNRLPTTSQQPPTPLWQSEPIVPTALPSGLASESQSRRAAALLSPAASSLFAGFEISSGVHSHTALPPADALERFGVGVPSPPLKMETAEALDLGWYLTWRALETPNRSETLEHWQMIRVSEEEFKPEQAVIQKVAQANPGAVWIIGNEPDVIWQDNTTPARYAERYYELYHFLKAVDPTCQVAMAGITQPTPLRLQYLERVMSSYRLRYGEAMPVDVWTVHNFILREERGEWGVDIPPGFAIDHGILYEIEDHDNLEIFKMQLLLFRHWMAEQGQRDKPLIVSEYGILMPADYGFDPERVQNFLQSTYEFMLTASDNQVGYPADNNRLVQKWAWYSLSDDRYPTGNFVDFTSGELTDLGKAHQKFITNLP